MKKKINTKKKTKSISNEATKNNISVPVVEAVAIGAGVAAIGAGAYYLLGPKGEEHQEKIKTLITEIKKEVDENLVNTVNTVKSSVLDSAGSIANTSIEKYVEHEDKIAATSKKLKKDLEQNVRKAKTSVKQMKG